VHFIQLPFISDTSLIRVLSVIRDEVSHPYKTTGRIIDRRLEDRVY